MDDINKVRLRKHDFWASLVYGPEKTWPSVLAPCCS